MSWYDTIAGDNTDYRNETIELDRINRGYYFTLICHYPDNRVSAPISVYCENPLVVSDLSLTIHSDSLKKAVLNEEYIENVLSVGGAHPVRWSLTSGKLPEGIALEDGDPNASLIGVPTKTGTHSFILQVRDAAGNVESKEFALKVLPYKPLD